MPRRFLLNSNSVFDYVSNEQPNAAYDFVFLEFMSFVSMVCVRVSLKGLDVLISTRFANRKCFCLVSLCGLPRYMLRFRFPSDRTEKLDTVMVHSSEQDLRFVATLSGRTCYTRRRTELHISAGSASTP